MASESPVNGISRQNTNIRSSSTNGPSVPQAQPARPDYMIADEIKSEVRRIVPNLFDTKYKGQSGKVAIVGGCLEYSSPAYFAAISALRAGADLTHVFCSDLATQVIKGYSPDITVHPYLKEAPTGQQLPHQQLVELAEAAAGEVEGWFSRLDCLVLGPGISRDPLLLETTRRIILKARIANMPMVIDADALFLVAREPELVKGYANCILTPNLTEYRRLAAILGVTVQVPGSDRNSKLQEVCTEMGGPTIISKGPTDAICDGSISITCSTSACPRRCGHLGHILAGCLGTMLAWTHLFIQSASQGEEVMLPEFNPMLLAAYGGCMLTRSATAYAFASAKRSMVASDVLGHVGHAVETLFETAMSGGGDANEHHA